MGVGKSSRQIRNHVHVNVNVHVRFGGVYAPPLRLHQPHRYLSTIDLHRSLDDRFIK